MPWNWQLPNWPKFEYDPSRIASLEKKFLLEVGSSSAYLKTIQTEEYQRFIVEVLSLEGVESSRIEGEILDRESLQSSIQQHFGLAAVPKKKGEKEVVAKLADPEKSMILSQFDRAASAPCPDLEHILEASRAQDRDGKMAQKGDFFGAGSFTTASKESRMAGVLCDVYKTFSQPLTHEMMYRWHAMLFKDSSSIQDWGKYRTHAEPMQIVSHRFDSPKVFFEAPPSSRVFKEMTMFIEWFNSPHSSVLERAAIAHVYFESIHPFEDGNGRIGRVLVEKILSQSVDRPILIAISKMLEKRKKEYYAALERCNRTLEVQQWLEFFSLVILEAHEESMHLLHFLMQKSKMLNALSEELNPRQMKVLLRMFAEGSEGFEGGLSAEKYIAIAKTSRPTATRDLTDLVEKGALVKTGELRYTRYWLNIHKK